MASIHSSPGAGKFGEDAELYDRARPPYPETLVRLLRDAVWAGAAKRTASKSAREQGHATLPLLGKSRTAISSPSSPMRGSPKDCASRREAMAGWTIEIRPFLSASLPPAAFDFGFAAMSMHWLPRMKALSRVRAAIEARRTISRCGGTSITTAAEPDAFGRASAAPVQRHRAGSQRHQRHRRLCAGCGRAYWRVAQRPVSRMSNNIFDQQVTFTPENLSALYATFSRVRMASAETRARLLNES